MVSESSQGIDQWLERENREKRVSRKGGSKKEREERKNPGMEAVHVPITIRTGRNHPRPRLEEGLLKLMEGRNIKKVQKLQPRYAMLELVIWSTHSIRSVLAPKTPGSLGLAKTKQKNGKSSPAISCLGLLRLLIRRLA